MPDYVSPDGTIQLWNRDCLEVLPTLEAGSVDAVVTSPPYAEQRKSSYGGVPERRYHVWTAAWIMALENSLTDTASVLVNIREHVANGGISDYVHRTRMLIREIGFNECDELLWVKPDAPPVGHVGRPRRSWERILWFSPSRAPYCDPRANGSYSKRLGFDGSGKASQEWLHGPQNGITDSGTSRHRDYVECGTGENEHGIDHPAKYPIALAEWLIRGWTPECGIVADPFMGSGTTGIACIRLGRRFIGIEREEKYFDIAVRRIEAELRQPRLFPAAPVERQVELFGEPAQ